MIGPLIGAGVGWATANTRFGIFVGRLIWYVLGAALIGCAVVGFVEQPGAVALFWCGFGAWLGYRCFVIGNRRGPSRWMRQWNSSPAAPPNRVRYAQVYECCRHCAGCSVRDVHPTPCRCGGQPALEVGRG